MNQPPRGLQPAAAAVTAGAVEGRQSIQRAANVDRSKQIDAYFKHSVEMHLLVGVNARASARLQSARPD